MPRLACLTRLLTVALLGLAACGGEKPSGATATTAAPKTAPAAAPSVTITTGAPPPSAGNYEATLAEGIQFDKPGYPKFIKAARGMSTYEKTHRWTEGGSVAFAFEKPLPSSFVLRLEVLGAFGPNAGKPVKVKVGDWQGQAVIAGNPQVIELRVKSSRQADTIEMTIAQPTSPLELGLSTDNRKLGLDFKRISISPS